jgi:hypothetical protein
MKQTLIEDWTYTGAPPIRHGLQPAVSLSIRGGFAVVDLSQRIP